MTPKSECPTCHRWITHWKWTNYLRAHKANGEWCPGGQRTTR